MKVRCIDTGGNILLTKGKEYEFIREEQFSKSKGYVVIADDKQEHWYRKEKFEIVKENDNMKKLTFKEVIANIKDGEVWENENLEITYNVECAEVVFKFKKCTSVGNQANISKFEEFALKRNKVSFAEAFKAYEEGKEIVSCVSETKYQKAGVKEYFKEVFSEWEEWEESVASFDFDEIRGEWYINE